MTIGERRMRNPQWHFAYHLTTLATNELRAARKQLSETDIPTDIFNEPSWIIDTEIAIDRELTKRLLDECPL